MMRTNRTDTPAPWALLLLVAATVWTGAATAATDAAARPQVAVALAQPQLRSIAQPVDGYGVIGADVDAAMNVNLSYTAKVAQFAVQAGQRVKRGATLFVVQPDPSALNAERQAATSARLAREDLAQTQALFKQALATRAQLEAANKAAADAQAALDMQHEMGVGKPRAAIVAPADGVVLQILVAQGDVVQAGGAILKLSASPRGSAATQQVVLGVEPDAAASIQPGDNVVLRGLSPAQSKVEVKGSVRAIGGAVDAQSGQVNVSIAADLTGSPLLPGTHVRGTIDTRNGVHWVVPRAALLSDDKGAYVFQVDQQHQARRVSVQPKVERGGDYGVDGKVVPGLGVVVVGNYELHEGDAVAVEPAPNGGDVKGTAQ